MAQIEGHCLCGAVTYSCAAAPVSGVVCHCKDCQRASGAPCAVLVGVPRGELQITGDEHLGAYTTADEEGDGDVVRQFCTECGSPLFSLPEQDPSVTLIKAGTLNDTSVVHPQVERCVDARHSYLSPAV